MFQRPLTMNLQEGYGVVQIHNMPSEVMMEVFNKLDLPSKLTCRLVCQSWKAVLDSDKGSHGFQFAVDLSDETVQAVQTFSEDLVAKCVTVNDFFKRFPTGNTRSRSQLVKDVRWLIIGHKNVRRLLEKLYRNTESGHLPWWDKTPHDLFLGNGLSERNLSTILHLYPQIERLALFDRCFQGVQNFRTLKYIRMEGLTRLELIFGRPMGYGSVDAPCSGHLVAQELYSNEAAQRDKCSKAFLCNTFPSLTHLTVMYTAKSFEFSLSILKFIGRHHLTLKSLCIFNGHTVLYHKPGARSCLATLRLREDEVIRRSICQVQVENLRIKAVVCDGYTRWGVFDKPFIESQRNLKSLHITLGFWKAEQNDLLDFQKIITQNAETLERLMIYYTCATNSISLQFNCQSLKMCLNLKKFILTAQEHLHDVRPHLLYNVEVLPVGLQRLSLDIDVPISTLDLIIPRLHNLEELIIFPKTILGTPLSWANLYRKLQKLVCLPKLKKLTFANPRFQMHRDLLNNGYQVPGAVIIFEGTAWSPYSMVDALTVIINDRKYFNPADLMCLGLFAD